MTTNRTIQLGVWARTWLFWKKQFGVQEQAKMSYSLVYEAKDKKSAIALMRSLEDHSVTLQAKGKLWRRWSICVRPRKDIITTYEAFEHLTNQMIDLGRRYHCELTGGTRHFKSAL